MILNIEFKAKSSNNQQLEEKLLSLQPRFVGIDHQVDTYFNVPHGRLKLREGNIENALIHYNRQNIQGAKQSDVILYRHQPSKDLKNILTTALGIKTIVDKKRKIYFLDNVKFHFDEVKELGTFVEVEAIDDKGIRSATELSTQCAAFAALFNIREEDYLAVSYSDMMPEL